MVSAPQAVAVAVVPRSRIAPAGVSAPFGIPYLNRLATRQTALQGGNRAERHVHGAQGASRSAQVVVARNDDCGGHAAVEPARSRERVASERRHEIIAPAERKIVIRDSRLRKAKPVVIQKVRKRNRFATRRQLWILHVARNVDPCADHRARRAELVIDQADVLPAAARHIPPRVEVIPVSVNIIPACLHGARITEQIPMAIPIQPARLHDSLVVEVIPRAIKLLPTREHKPLVREQEPIAIELNPPGKR